LAQNDAVVNKVLGLLVAKAVESLDDEHPQDHLDGRGMAPQPPRVGVACGQVGFHHFEESVVIEQFIKVGQLRFELKLKFGNHLEEVYGVVSIDYHDSWLRSCGAYWA
jgi:hypothetical protein